MVVVTATGSLLNRAEIAKIALASDNSFGTNGQCYLLIDGLLNPCLGMQPVPVGKWFGPLVCVLEDQGPATCRCVARSASGAEITRPGKGQVLFI